MFNFFRQKPGRTGNFDFLGVDIHSHLIPGIDDGAQDMAASLSLVKGMQALGFKSLITTPHIMTDLYPNTPEIIQKGLQQLRRALQEAAIDVAIDAAAEYLMDEAFAEKIAGGKLLTLKDHYVLVEMSFISPPPNAEELFFQMQTKGYRPVMAHPERYFYLHRDFTQYGRLKDRGCLLQLNLLSVTGHYGPDVRRVALKMLKSGLYDLAGTDLHHERHRQALHELLQDPKNIQPLTKYPWQNTRLFSGSLTPNP